jgi:CheY-like chemotaxis protein
VKLVNDSANVLLNIINDVIDISRMEEGKMKLDQVSFDLKQVVESIFKLLEAYASQKNLGFELNFDPALNQIVKGDPVRLRQVLINILGNAIKFTENGRVRLICKPVFTHDHKIQVSFVCEDTGVGISDEMKKRLFQDFSQEDESFQRKFGGSGLGLAITNELIKLMDGTIQIDSEKNMGTQVHILLPFSTNHVIDAPVIEKIPIDKDKLKKIKVLIAEDNQFNRVLLQVIFNKNEIYNDMAVNGLEAYNLCMNNDYDIILMDIQMPEMDGLEAMRKIRADKSNRIPIIAVTANAIQEELKFYMDEGFNDFITKPFTEEALLVKMLSFT